MNKAELTGKIAEELDITKTLAGEVLNSFIKNVQESLKAGEKVTLIGFGTFSVAQRKARAGRNPQTGKKIKIPAKKVPKFTAGTAFKAMFKK
ncbi:MAG: HU family DNA-binding protein [Syntrophorhabdaceae bacterium]|jgi:DNA-binding protein HU-beta|nr:HU family DNA-binding protein [Syntrophorhabdales bacterium]MBP9561299.1 HU family DNA-binding protein [Syntrophorhabdaceae bacterium]